MFWSSYWVNCLNKSLHRWNQLGITVISKNELKKLNQSAQGRSMDSPSGSEFGLNGSLMKQSDTHDLDLEFKVP